MEQTQAASEGDQAEFPMKPLGSQVAEPQQPQVSASERRLESPESSPRLVPAVKGAEGTGRDLAGGKKQPPPRPAFLRLPPPSLGYGAFRRQASAGSEPPSPEGVRKFSRWDGGAVVETLVLFFRRKQLNSDLSCLSPPPGLPLYLKSLRWALAIMAVFLAVSAVAIVVLASRTGVTCRPCPPGWMWCEEHCYYLSAEARAWEASQAFCLAHHATLPLLDHTKDFLSRYPLTKHSWLGARRGPQGWHWIDGAPLPPQLLPEEDEDQPGLKCGGLEEGKLVAWDCASPRPWVCARGTK
ncbi:killer cell lectin-like receptor subfamily G member 2 [Suricata suricatta]|uniref:killer cell lectin-like receptor subfamily G member 2 n=1 Tax=Suricata suricatta TaxID=37032 RepID=UPI0011558DB7|nr:killer cell lectin-like receptor subfamily G member 2 [Suricata suricatta]